MLQQPAPSPAPGGEAPQPGLVDALLGIQGDLALGQSPSPPPEASSDKSSPPADGAASAPCTDPSLLTQTMTTFCKLGSLDQLAAIDQAAVQACCRLTSLTLQSGCWDACSPPPPVSPEVLVGGHGGHASAAQTVEHTTGTQSNGLEGTELGQNLVVWGRAVPRSRTLQSGGSNMQ